MILKTFSLDFQWPTLEPFLFCAHHNDHFPPGNGQLGIDPSHLNGRQVGQDFEIRDGFRMYHGDDVPGFPVHPHRGFETVTIVRKGYVDHADSLGAAGRYGQGDVQWMTAGAGVQHSEMFPLLKTNEKNTAELFQIWLNLPQANKMVAPDFKMFWSDYIPSLYLDDCKVKATLIAGNFEYTQALPPPPNSWAADPNNEVLIMLVKISKGGIFNLARSKQSTSRMIYFYEGIGLTINQQPISPNTGVQLDSNINLQIEATTGEVELLILQARPIGEPVVQHGPFVMNTRAEITEAIQDYQRTQFGGWPWPRNDMVHGQGFERFAKYPDGKIDKT